MSGERPPVEPTSRTSGGADDLGALVLAQRRYFESGATRPYAFRRAQLEALRSLVADNEAAIHEALAADLGKPAFEAYASETGFLRAELGWALDHLREWMAPERVPSPWVLFPSTSYIHREPLGVVLVIGPWNYPFQLVIAPLVGALAAGNCAIVKPSEWAPETARLSARLVAERFPPELVAAVTGGAGVAKALLEHRFDHVFFTGSVRTGRKVAVAAAEHLTPVTLELGGKSPAIVEPSAKLGLAAKRIAWGKFLNAGQTCIAPDYALVAASQRAAFIQELQRQTRRFFGDDPSTSPDYARIVDERQFQRLRGLLAGGRIAFGGETDAAERYIAPTVIEEVSLESDLMREEIFGPILPVLTYDDLDEALAVVKRHPNPLSLYLFTKDREVERRVLDEVPFGGGAVNECLMHFSNPALPFGGRGASGMGRYHGRFGFDTFSHHKPVVRGAAWIDPPLRYPPYAGKLSWLRKLLR